MGEELVLDVSAMNIIGMGRLQRKVAYRMPFREKQNRRKVL
jgi:hypothetical protein